MTALASWSPLLEGPLRKGPFQFIHGMRHTVPLGLSCRPHAHPDIEIVYHPIGRGLSRSPEQDNLPFREGHVVIYAPGQIHDQINDAEGEDLCIQIAAPPGSEKKLPHHGFSVGPLTDLALSGEIAALSKGKIGLGASEQAILDFRATAVLLDLIQLARDGEFEPRNASSEHRVLQAERYIGEHFGQIENLGEVATHVGVSHDHLRHAFKAHRGKSLVRHLTDVRVARAQALLLHSLLPLKQIAAMCGFRDEYYFSAVFRRCIGTPPGAYRSKQRT
jgi:AraC-like DNA-binding protein